MNDILHNDELGVFFQKKNFFLVKKMNFNRKEEREKQTLHI